jgi:glutathione synthase/RimK-type ligase-like ATP-grasp enzyme
MVRFAIIGNPGSNRVEFFQAALDRAGLPPARLITYTDIIQSRAMCDCAPDEILRIESPGRDWEVQKALLKLGANIEDTKHTYWRLAESEVDSLTFEKGRILPSRQWFLGYCAVLSLIEDATAQNRIMNTPADIRLMFDKRACHAHLEEHRIAVPSSFTTVHCYDELLAQMRERHCSRVFIKPAHGSSASGVIAYRVQGDQHQAISTIEMVRADGALYLYNSRQMQTYTDQVSIAELIDAMCAHRVHIEEWIPKASHAGQTFDLRIVMIAGDVRHVVVRMSHRPMTNLHLLNARTDIDSLLQQIGIEDWVSAKQTCQQVAQSFRSLYCGIDLMFTPTYKQHAVLEVNAFGDLLPGVLDNGQDTYTAEIMAMIEAT